MSDFHQSASATFLLWVHDRAFALKLTEPGIEPKCYEGSAVAASLPHKTSYRNVLSEKVSVLMVRIPGWPFRSIDIVRSVTPAVSTDLPRAGVEGACGAAARD
jgi:hypothetical protein